MRTRCTRCNRADEFTHKKGSNIREMACPCGVKGYVVLMRQREVLGEAPVDGFTHKLFDKVYHKIYTGGGEGEYLYDRANGRFVKIETVTV